MKRTERKTGTFTVIMMSVLAALMILAMLAADTGCQAAGNTGVEIITTQPGEAYAEKTAAEETSAEETTTPAPELDIADIDGTLYYVLGDDIQYGYTGIVSHDGEEWWIEDGRADASAEGLYEYDGDMLFVYEGRIERSYTGLVQSGDDWWYVTDGVADAGFTGLAENEYGWWYVDAGKVCFDYNGTYTSPEGVMYNIVGGQVAPETGYVETVNENGLVLRGTVYKPGTYNGKTLIISHGIADTSGRFTDLASDLANWGGYCVFTFDFAGGSAYSSSDGDTLEMSVLTELADLESIFAYVELCPYVDPDRIYLAGHSQGGIVSGLFAAQHPEKVRAMVLYAPGFVVCEDWAPESYYDIPDGANYIDNGTFIGPRYYEDLWWLLEGDDDRIYSLMSPYGGPVLMIHGTYDQVTPLSYTWKMYDYYSNSAVYEYDGANHCFDNGDFHWSLVSDTAEFLSSN